MDRFDDSMSPTKVLAVKWCVEQMSYPPSGLTLLHPECPTTSLSTPHHRAKTTLRITHENIHAECVKNGHFRLCQSAQLEPDFQGPSKADQSRLNLEGIGQGLRFSKVILQKGRIDPGRPVAKLLQCTGQR